MLYRETQIVITDNIFERFPRDFKYAARKKKKNYNLIMKTHLSRVFRSVSQGKLFSHGRKMENIRIYLAVLVRERSPRGVFKIYPRISILPRNLIQTVF